MCIRDSSILSRGVKIGKNAKVKNCILLQDTVIEDGANQMCIRDRTGDRVLKGQTVTYNGQVVSKEEEMILIALNKPAGIVFTAEKREKNNVIDYLNYPKMCIRDRVEGH